jgi:O-antigen biosynthesis protein
MPLKRLAILLPGLGINGGINIVLNWAVILARSGYQVDLVFPEPVDGFKPFFLSDDDARLLRPTYLAAARRLRYHAAFATWWGSIATLAELEAEHYAWFMQGYERQFLAQHAPISAVCDELFSSEINVIATALWLKEHMIRHYNTDPGRTFYVVSGLDKKLWRPGSREHAGAGGQPVTFLVEGPVHDPRKNVARTITLLERLGLPYSWVGSFVDRSVVGPHCRTVLDRVPYERMPEVYAAADVLVKASNAEGMFGPPLEMFSSGGTAVAWDVQGAEEYMADRYNSRLVPMNSWSHLSAAILELAGDPAYVRSLQEKASATASAWPTWDDQAEAIVATVGSLVPGGRASLLRRCANSRFRSIPDLTATIAEIRRAADESARATAQATAQATALEAQVAAEWAQADGAVAALQESVGALQDLQRSRAWQLARWLHRARSRLAPDGSKRWAYTEAAARAVIRTGRRLRSAAGSRRDCVGASQRRTA